MKAIALDKLQNVTYHIGVTWRLSSNPVTCAFGRKLVQFSHNIQLRKTNGQRSPT